MRKSGLHAIVHSTRPIGEPLGLLEALRVRKVVDVWMIPRSHHNPQHDHTALQQTVKAPHIRYQHLRKLGGRRHARTDSPNAGWINASFRLLYPEPAQTDARS